MTEEIIDLTRLETYRENNRIEAKKALGGLPRSLWETYSAFANTLGGIILLGVEERKDHSFLVHNLPDPQGMMNEFWRIVTDKRFVNKNVLSRGQVRSVRLDGKAIVAISVPRAGRREKPVSIGMDVYTGTYRRDGEGDYHCTREEVDAMLRDAKLESQDNVILEYGGREMLDGGTVARYRKAFSRERPGHIWQSLSDEAFLEKLSAFQQGRDGKRHPTAAGLLMFGKEKEILREFPCYMLDYQELKRDGNWEDRIVSDSGDWSGNLFDFYCLVYGRIQREIKVPDVLDRRQDTPLHKALKEVLANCLVHADYKEKQGVLIQKRGRRIVFENPGSFGTDKEQAVGEGSRDPRNPALINIFHLINIGNGAGRGLSRVYELWKELGFALPEIREEFRPPRTQVSLEIAREDEAEANGKPEDAGDIRSSGKYRRPPKEIIYEAQKQQVIDFVTRSIQVRAAAVAKLLNIGVSGAKELLSRMVGEGILERVGEKDNRFYQLKR